MHGAIMKKHTQKKMKSITFRLDSESGPIPGTLFLDQDSSLKLFSTLVLGAICTSQPTNCS